MARKKLKATSPKPNEVRQVSPQLQAGVERFAKAIGHMILIRVNPEAARQMAEE